ncbi:MAG: AsnC family transcriptional regulator [Desulfomonilia bacterium]
MDDIDKKILNIMNRAFPLQQRPYLHISRDLGISEDEVILRVDALKEAGIIRRIGATIDPKRIGWYSTLCAVDVPDDMMEAYVRIVNAYPEVTHNYLRQGSPNCWFTLIAPDAERAADIIAEISGSLRLDILNLPARKVFKISVSFELE